jgi:hypothetical protein
LLSVVALLTKLRRSTMNQTKTGCCGLSRGKREYCSLRFKQLIQRDK